MTGSVERKSAYQAAPPSLFPKPYAAQGIDDTILFVKIFNENRQNFTANILEDINKKCPGFKGTMAALAGFFRHDGKKFIFVAARSTTPVPCGEKRDFVRAGTFYRIDENDVPYIYGKNEFRNDNPQLNLNDDAAWLAAYRAYVKLVTASKPTAKTIQFGF